MSRVLLKIDKTLRCGCNPGVATQASVIPFRHAHVPVGFTQEQADQLGWEPVPAPKRVRPIGGRASKWVMWLEKHRLVAYPKGLSKRERKALGA